MSFNSTKAYILSQNQEDFKIDLNTQPFIFKYNYFIKESDPI